MRVLYGMDNFSSIEEFKIQYALGTVSSEVLCELIEDDQTPTELIKYLVSSCREPSVCGHLVYERHEQLTSEDVLTMLQRHLHPALSMLNAITLRPKFLQDRIVIDVLLDIMLNDIDEYSGWLYGVINGIERKEDRFYMYRRILKATQHPSTWANSAESVIGKALTALYLTGEVTLKEE